MAARFNREAAEREANEIAFQFRDSHDVVADMSRAYHTDFSGIRMYEDDAAQARVNAAGTDALAQGNNIYFRYGILNENDQASRGLVAHELAHTMQQGIVAGDVAESAPAGAEQGGFLDWIKGVFGSRRRPQYQYLGGEKATDQASLDYMAAMRAREAELVQQKRAAAMGSIADITNVAPSPELLQQSTDMMVGRRQMADEKWDQRLADGANRATATAGAYLALGHRVGGEVQTLDKRIQAQAFQGLAGDAGRYLRNMDANGANFQQMAQNMKKYELGAKTFYANDAIGGIAQDMYSQAEKYILSEGGLDYFENLTDGVKDSKVFTEGGASPIDYAMKTMLTIQGINIKNAWGMQDGYTQEGQDADARNQIASEAFRNLMVPTNMVDMSQEERDAMPIQIRSLYTQYVDIKRKLADALGARKAARGATA